MRDMDSAQILRRDPSSDPQTYTNLSSSQRRNGGQEPRRVGLEASRKTLSQILTFSGLTLSASEETGNDDHQGFM